MNCGEAYPFRLGILARRLGKALAILVLVSFSLYFIGTSHFPDRGIIQSPDPTEQGPTQEQAPYREATFVGGMSNAAVPSPVFVSDLALELTGVAITEHKRIALITTNAGPEKAYLEGDQISDRVTLKMILPDHITVEANGKLASIRLHRLSRDIGKSATMDADHPDPVLATVPLAYPLVLPSDEAADGTTEPYVLAQSDLQEYLNPAKITEQARVVSHIDGGFQIVELPAGSILKKLGMQPGDIVTTVNDLKLDSLPDFLAAYQDLTNHDQVKLKLVRDGVTWFWEFKKRDK